MTTLSRIKGNWGEVALLGGAAVVTGLLASVLPAAGLLLLAAALGLWLAIVLIGFGGGKGGSWHPALMLLTGLAVLSVTWNGMPPASVALPDLFLVAALAALAYCWALESVRVPVPGWLVGAAALLLATELIAELFVPEPPVDPPPAFTPPGSPLVTLARVELGMLIVPIVVGAVASSWRRANLLADLWVVGAVIAAVIATIDAATGAGIGVSITGVQEAGRAAGLAIHFNAFALTCAMALPVALLRAVQRRGAGRAAAVAATGLLLLGILSSGSRVGLLSALLAIGLMGLSVARLRGRVIAAGLAGIVVLLLVASLAPAGSSLFSGFDRLGGGGSASGANTQRFDQLSESLEIALDHPVTGVGFSVIADAHSLPVQFWEAAGLLGVLALIVYVAGVFLTGWRLMRDPTLPKGIPELATALTVSFAVWLISGLFQNQVADRYIYVPVGLLLGLTLAAGARDRARGRSDREPAPLPPAPDPAPKPLDRVPA